MKTENGNFILPKNVITKGKWFGIQRQNYYEAFFFTTLVFIIIAIVPFTKIARVMFSIVLCTLTFYVFLKGIQERSLLQVLMDELKYRNSRCKLHLRGPEYVRKESKYKNYENSNATGFEAVFKKLKTRINEFIAEYGED